MNNNEQLKKQLLDMLDSASSEKPDTAGLQGIVSGLSDEDKLKLNAVLNDPEAQKKLLNSPLAKKIMKNFSGK